MAKLIDGKLISAEVLDSVRGRVEYLKSRGVEPCLAVIIVGDDPASRVYVNNKKKSCEKVGIKSLEFALPADTKQEELIALIDRLNADSSVSGILCQLPVPEHIDSEEIIRRISPEKDVDCFHPQNVGAVVTGGNVFLPCTPAGIVEMLHHEKIETAGKTALSSAEAISSASPWQCSCSERTPPSPSAILRPRISPRSPQTPIYS